MSLLDKLRRGEGPVWGRLKRTARAAQSVHVPVNPLTRPLFAVLYRLHVTARETWIWATRFFWFEPLFRSQCVAVGPGFQMEALPYLTGRGHIRIGARVRLSGKSTFQFNNRGGIPELIVGDETFIGHNCRFSVARSVQIGAHCYLAGGVSVLDQDGHPVDWAARRAGEPSSPEAIAAVVIADDVWIGDGAVILKGVTIGPRSIVAARAVVTRDVPADSVAAGNPARVVKSLAGDS